ncbi:MAG: tetratricopeptide repeat protein [Xenococcaceae cyanobacterium MO_207.B15]|nr:tetratricopeptide repeat protein [Xenococcaceae cyanobacterium MO_207.B15]
MFGKLLVNLFLPAGISGLLFLTYGELKSIFPLSEIIATNVKATKLTNRELETIAQAITVKVHVGEYRGSGILINRNNNTYTVITNAHVAERGDTYNIETSDGIKHTATLIHKDSSETGNDLAKLQFKSSNNYHIAIFGYSTNLAVGEEVLAAGFPFDADKLNITEGTISLLPDKSLQGGYQIGFTNETRQGMSGGVLLNSQGKVIGVLGKGKGAIFDSGYTYSDGTNPTGEELDNLRDASFSIPIAKVAAILPETATQPRPYTGIVGKVDRIAQQITVRIDNLTNNSNGSGVIIAKQGKSYYVVTAKHVLCTNLDTPKCEANGQHQIVTPDGITHKLDYRTVQAPQTWLDVAVFRFESNNNYSVATLGKYDVGDKWIFVSGFPGIDSTSKTQPFRLLTGGTATEKYQKDFNRKDAYSLKDIGEGLIYTNMSYRGMSGGAVLDAQGRLVGINTGAENEIEDGNYSEVSLGYSLGVRIQDFLSLVQKGNMKLKPQWLQIETNPTAEISDAEIITIQEQLLTTTKPGADAGAAAWVNYGNQLWRYERYEEAVNAFEKAIELEPNFDRAYYAMGAALYSQKNYEQAVSALKQAIEINPSPYYYWRYLGLSYGFLENYAEARTAYDTAISKNPEDFVLYVQRGYLLDESSDYQGAIDSYNQAIKLKDDHPWVYNNRGFVYYQLKEYDRAIADYNQAIEINTQYTQAYNNRGVAYHELKQPEPAIANYNQAIEINPQFADAYNNRGVLYSDLKQYETAIADLTKAIEINPEDAKAYNNRALTYSNLQQYDEAIADYSKAIEIQPQFAIAVSNRALIYSNLQQYDEAIADYNKAIEINPNFAEAYGNRAFIYSNLQQYDEAIADYNKAIEINPNFAEAYGNRGTTYNEIQQYDKAVKDLTKAISLNPDLTEAYINRGISYRQLEQYDNALADFTQAIKINPQLEEGYFKRGGLYKDLKQYDLAIADLTQTIKLNHQNAYAYVGLGLIYYQLKDIPQAQKYFEQAASLFEQQEQMEQYQNVQVILRGLANQQR